MIMQSDLEEAPSGQLMDIEVRVEDKLPDESPAPLMEAGFNLVAGHDLKKSERNILSIFGSSRSCET